MMPSGVLTPEELLSQARRFDVDLAREPYLLPLMKQIVTIPKPPNRQHDDDESASERYFIDQIKVIRHRQQQQQGNHTAWMSFEETPPHESGHTTQQSTTYYYNFISGARQDMHPLVPVLGDNEWANSDDDPMTRAADPQEFEHAATLHKQTSMRK
ncbi:unnamed protein product [Phytophthora lilii]|uniref:Unnamed protein product n=1 Tax=Phytophthora lilii TaxID=2077276 RepID=A0A9W6TDK5_9STRA|nr:unnamed protein product [Phytophthora lilii]